MGSSESIILKYNDKSLIKKSDGSYVWVVKNNDNDNLEIKNNVSVKNIYEFDGYYKINDIFVLNDNNNFSVCQYLDYKENGKYMFNTIKGISGIYGKNISKYEIRSENYSNGFFYSIYVIK